MKDSAGFDHPGSPYPDRCETCKAKVILHCDDCKVQMTVCVCSMREEISHQAGPERLRELEDESRRDRLKQKGVWTP